MKNKTIVFAGPSAVGKTYIADELMRLYPNTFEQAQLYTTRKKRTGETATDRIFVSEDEFKKLNDNKKFTIQDTFGGSRYGFTKESISPTNKHLLVNAWPWLVPEFAKQENVLIIGMQAPNNWESMLEKRMFLRGDSKETIETRKGLIKKDIENLEINKSVVNSNGNYFVIKNDDTIHSEVIPWIEKSLNL